MRTVTLVEGSSFCICADDGDIRPGGTEGLYHHDTRVLSGWRLLIDGRPAEPLAAMALTPFSARFLLRRARREGSGTLFCERTRLVGDGMREDIVLRNLGREDTACQLTVLAEADLADIFAVRAGATTTHPSYEWSVADGELVGRAGAAGAEVGVRIAADPAATPAPGLITAGALIPAQGVWRLSVQVRPSRGGVEAPVQYPDDRPVTEAAPVRRLRRWQQASPVLSCDDRALERTIARTVEDLGALRVFDAPGGSGPVIAAGAPWFMTLFGRDSLLTAWMTLPIDPGLAGSTLRALAHLQGRTEDRLTEEQPGRILHEVRHGSEFPLAPGAGTYYGSIDSTPLFVMLLGELARWGVDAEFIADLLPAADRALDWMLSYGDRDGDGFLEYQRSTDRGLANQGWKDSDGAVVFASGRPAEPPIALCEVQGYAYAAFIARAHLASELGDVDTARTWARRAAQLRTAFHRAFWMPDRGYYALALDGDKRQVDGLASNMAHCLWTGIADPACAEPVAERLMSPEMFSGWGIRTLATTMAAYDPVSYHNGSVWPHDNAIAAAGLMRYGLIEAARRVARAVFDAAAAFDGRLPELFCGFDREEFPAPVPYPTSCSPQAWAAGTPLLMLRTLLRLEPAVPRGQVNLAPVLPDGAHRLTLEHLPLAGARVRVSVENGAADVAGLPDNVALIREPRSALGPLVLPAN